MPKDKAAVFNECFTMMSRLVIEIPIEFPGETVSTLEQGACRAHCIKVL
jgi:hypothetical protein